MRLAITALVFLVAGCGGGEPRPAKLDDSKAIGDLIGCETALRPDAETIAQEEEICQIRNVDVHITRFSNLATAEQFIELGSSVGKNYALVNENWTVSSSDRQLIAELAKENSWKLY